MLNSEINQHIYTSANIDYNFRIIRTSNIKVLTTRGSCYNGRNLRILATRYCEEAPIKEEANRHDAQKSNPENEETKTAKTAESEK